MLGCPQKHSFEKKDVIFSIVNAAWHFNFVFVEQVTKNKINIVHVISFWDN